MQAEEPGGIPLVGRLIKKSVIPPSPSNENTTKTEMGPGFDSAKPDVSLKHTKSSKRPYSDLQNSRADDVPTKILRTDRRDSKISQGNEDEYHRPISRSSGYEAFRRLSTDRRVERDFPRSFSRERGLSPDRRAFDSRQPNRSRGYSLGPDENCDYDERDERDPRSFDRGRYRGKSFDPHYHTRGRGARGRGDYSRYVADPRPDSGPPGAFRSKIANGRPYKDDRGFNKGGNGG